MLWKFILTDSKPWKHMCIYGAHGILICAYSVWCLNTKNRSIHIYIYIIKHSLFLNLNIKCNTYLVSWFFCFSLLKKKKKTTLLLLICGLCSGFLFELLPWLPSVMDFTWICEPNKMPSPLLLLVVFYHSNRKAKFWEFFYFYMKVFKHDFLWPSGLPWNLQRFLSFCLQFY